MLKRNKPTGATGPMVSVDKKFGRSVLVGIVDSNRMITHGFDVDFPSYKMHFRTMRHGAFSVLVGTQDPVEVRVIMDGQLLLEQRLDPLPQPTGRTDSQVVRQVREIVSQPQPFFLTTADNGQPLTFAPDSQGRSAAELMQLQIHPEPFTPVSGPAVVRREEPQAEMHAKPDLDPSQVGMVVPPAPPVSDRAAGVKAPAAGEPGGAAEEAGETPEASGPARVVPASAQLPVDEHEVEPSDYHIELPLPRMAPSHGLVVVGIRMVQVKVEGEPTMPPDGFAYVLFQLNTWDEHLRVRANLHSKINLPERIPYREIDDGTNQGEPPALPHSGCGCTDSHDRRHR